MGIRPLTFILPDAQPTDSWTEADKKLLLAWTILQKETCHECGNPLWICRSSDPNVSFSVRKGMCYSKLAVEKWRETPAGKNLKNGEVPYVVAIRYDESKPLPTRREYIDQLEEE